MDWRRLAEADVVPSGLLPKWLLLVGAVASLNAVQNFVRPSFSAKVYSSSAARTQVTPLSARLFAVWNLTSALVRLYAAYNLHERGAYILCLGTFVIALVHFVSEFVYFGTLAVVPGSISPLLVACTCVTDPASSAVAMVAQYSYYVA